MAARWQLATAGLLVVVGLALLLTVTLLFTLTGGKIPFDYGVMIDAGSSHSSGMLYKWQGDKDRGTGRVEQIGKECRVAKGISTYEDPMEAGMSILPCLKTLTSLVPEEKRTSTAVYLGATAGMRILRETNPYHSLAIFTALSCTLPKSSLKVKEVGIISGEDEGQFAWITNNFLLEILQNRQGATVGAVDLGGASTQIAFQVAPAYSDDPKTSKLKLYGTEYNLYSTTSLCYGTNEVYRRYLASLVKNPTSDDPVVDPCSHKGQTVKQTASWLFNQPCTKTEATKKWICQDNNNLNKTFSFEGSSDLDKCKTAVTKLYDETDCKSKYKECFATSIPTQRSENFTAFSGIFFTVSFMNASKGQSLNEFRENVKNWCGRDWKDIMSYNYSGGDAPSVPKYCFQANMVDILLTKGYGFDSNTWENIQFRREIKKIGLGWTIGYMINSTNAIPESEPSPPALGEAAFIVLLVFSILLLLAGLVFAIKIVKEK